MTHHDHGDPGSDDPELATMLDLDGELLGAYWAEALAWVRRAASASRRSRLLDLGAGTGTATIGLAHRFRDAEVVAVDSSPGMLARIRAKALDLGLAGRVRTVHADLDLGLPDVGPVDVTWASMSLHHLAAPDRVLAEVRAATRPGGLVAVAEFAEPMRVLPDDLGAGRPGLERRCLDAVRGQHADLLPHLGADWAARLDAAGFGLVEERVFDIDLPVPGRPAAARFAHLWLRRLRSALADRLDGDDLAALDGLLDPRGAASVLRREDLRLRGRRTVTLASA